MGFSTFDVGGCNCATPGQTFTVQGCNLLPYAGLTVTVKDPTDTTTYASGTTDASGDVTLTWSGTMTNVWVHVTGQSARFQAFAQQYTLTSGGTTDLGLSPATGYDCGPACMLPLADTLHLSWTGSMSSGSPATLTFGSGLWTGTFVDGLSNTWSVNYDGDVTLNIQSNDGSCTIPTTSGSVTCPPSFNFSGTSGATCGGITYSMTTTITE